MSKTNKFVKKFTRLRTPDSLEKAYLEIWEARQIAKESLEDLPQFQSYLEADKALEKLRNHLEDLAYKEENLNQKKSTAKKLVYEFSGKMMTFTYTRSLPEPRWRRGRISLSSFKLKQDAKAS